MFHLAPSIDEVVVQAISFHASLASRYLAHILCLPILPTQLMLESLGADDIFIAYLPLAHVLELASEIGRRRFACAYLRVNEQQ